MAAMSALAPDGAALSIEVRAKHFPPLGKAPATLVLQGVSFQVRRGETVALTGPSGCGKTTLLNILAGLEAVGDGRIVLASGATVAYVFQEPRLLPWRTVKENLELVVDEGPDTVARVDRALAEVGLDDARDVYASRLSLGMARRVALARGFIVRPDLLLLDEPFVSLDDRGANRLRLLLLELLERHRTSAVFVTHRVSEAIMLATRLLVLSGPPGTVQHDVPIDLSPAERRSAATIARVQRLLVDRGVIDGETMPDG